MGYPPHRRVQSPRHILDAGTFRLSELIRVVYVDGAKWRRLRSWSVDGLSAKRHDACICVQVE
jgi:hypothetical protein